ncbi:MAG: transketolase [Alphaproteobacteria bacterium]|nr:transketolase [Alphaproteobacteria bacterium]
MTSGNTLLRAVCPECSSELDDRSLMLRRMVVRALVKAGRGHLGPAMSLIEILRVFYDDILRIRPDDPSWADRDRLILSKGHGCLALYALLADKGFFPPSVLDTFCAFDSILGGHPEYGSIPGVEASTGALGHGLSIGLGLALAARLKRKSWRVFVVMGDGELNEGSVWEAAMAASKHRVDSLTAVIDYNKMQSYGPTSVVLDMEPLADKWRSFGFAVREVDGHNVSALREALSGAPFESGRPSALICHTVKGKGVPMAENNADWHHKNKLKDNELTAIRAALGDF